MNSLMSFLTLLSNLKTYAVESKSVRVIPNFTLLSNLK